MAAELTNPALAPVAFLVGEWDMTLSGASFLADAEETLTGHVEVDLIEGGSLLAMRQAGDSPGPPRASWVIGRDAARPGYTVLYTDGRGVSRVYEMSLTDDEWTMWREDAEFSQRFEATISPDRRTMTGRWEKRSAGGEWEQDFDLTYRRPAE